MGAPTSAKITHAAAIAYFFWISTSYPAARWYAERMRCSSPAVAPTVTRLVGGICAAGAGAGAGAGMPGVERCAGGGRSEERRVGREWRGGRRWWDAKE